MLAPEQFETSDALPTFALPVERLWMGGIDLGPADIPANYNADWRIVLQLGSFASLPFAIVGESRGSYIAHGMVHTNPSSVSGVALIVPGGSPTADPARLPAHSVMEIDRSIREDMTDEEAERFDNFYVVHRRDILEKARSSKYHARTLWDPEQAARINNAFDFSFHAAGEATTFDGPSLILAGRQDSMSGYLDAIDLLPQFTRATLAVLDTAGHGLAWERPKLFNALLLDWLERVDSCDLCNPTRKQTNDAMLSLAYPELEQRKISEADVSEAGN